MIYDDIGKRIQKAREEAGFSQEQLACMIGITQSALSNYELGKRRLHLANLQEIARSLNKPLGCFLDFDEQESESESGIAEAGDEITVEIMGLVSELPPEERLFILEYVKWRKERLKGSR